jgi:ATP-binding cassette subfamily B protein
MKRNFQPAASTNKEVPLNLLMPLASDSRAASDLSKAFETGDFQLGDELLNHTVAANLSSQTVDSEQNSNAIYIVCQGRVRLVAFDPGRQREVSALVLETGDTFGGDRLFCNDPIPYRAIAASAGSLARISISKLQPELSELSDLRDHLQQQAELRQRQLFFKTHTELRSLSSHQLLQLLPYLTEKRIDRGAQLQKATPAQTGRFWLRSGKIHQPSNPSQPKEAGCSWGYPSTTPADWVAETDLWVVQLPTEHWEAAQSVAPALAKAVGEIAAANGHLKPAASFQIGRAHV